MQFYAIHTSPRFTSCTNYQKCKFQMARSRLYQRRFLRPRPHFSAFFELYIFFFCTIPDFCDFSSLCTIFCKICRIFCGFSKETADFANFRQISTDFSGIFAEFQHFAKNGAKIAMFQRNLRKFAEISQNFAAKLLKFCQKKCML